MKKILLAILVLATLSAVLWAGCGTPLTATSPNGAESSELVFSLSGSGNATSETFYITSEDWYIDWSYEGSGIGVTIYLYPQNAVHFEDLWIDSFGSNSPGDNRVCFHNQIGGFYLYILSVGEWQIAVYE